MKKYLQIKNTDKFYEANEFYYPILSDIEDIGALPEDSSAEGYGMLVRDLKLDRTEFQSFK